MYNKKQILENVEIYDFIVTRSNKRGEDVGFVIETGKENEVKYFIVMFSAFGKVKYYCEQDKKTRYIKEIWKPVDENTYKKYAKLGETKND